MTITSIGKERRPKLLKVKTWKSRMNYGQLFFPPRKDLAVFMRAGHFRLTKFNQFRVMVEFNRFCIWHAPAIFPFVNGRCFFSWPRWILDMQRSLWENWTRNSNYLLIIKLFSSCRFFPLDKGENVWLKVGFWPKVKVKDSDSKSLKIPNPKHTANLIR